MTVVRPEDFYPIESVDGYRIGTLCVYDAAPHDQDEFDLSMLRDCALLAEGELLDATNLVHSSGDGSGARSRL